MTAKRPLLRYHGGKWKLSQWVISHFPPHRVYVEPYGGAASVLLRKARSYAEVYNDMDEEVVNLFKVVRDNGAELTERLKLTPFSRLEYKQSFAKSDDHVEQARRTVVRSLMGFGSNSLCRTVKSGFRSNSNRSGTTPARDWQTYPEHLDAIIERLRGVVIECRPALEVVKCHDGPDTLHYIDPPYVHSTRTKWAGSGARSGYNHEMSDDDHKAMGKVLNTLKGAVIVSGYDSQLYSEIFRDWKRVECNTHADGARERVEVLWMRNVKTPGYYFLPGL